MCDCLRKQPGLKAANFDSSLQMYSKDRDTVFGRKAICKAGSKSCRKVRERWLLGQCWFSFLDDFVGLVLLRFSTRCKNNRRAEALQTRFYGRMVVRRSGRGGYRCAAIA